MADNQLPINILQKLRKDNIITAEEIALQVGDLLIAENVLSRDRRVLGKAIDIISEGKRILKG